jgi:hypothetical protein
MRCSPVLPRFFGWGFWGFVGVFVGFQVLGLVMFVLRAILSWIAWGAGVRKQMVGHIFEVLSTNSYPVPGSAYGSAEDYLLEVASDESVPIETRLHAAAEIGTMRAFRGRMDMIFDAMQVAMAYEEAVEQYRRVALPKQPSIAAV